MAEFPIYNTRSMCTKFHLDISVLTKVTACTDRRTDGQTVSYPDFNLSLHSDHLHIYYPISGSIGFG